MIKVKKLAISYQRRKQLDKRSNWLPHLVTLGFVMVMSLQACVKDPIVKEVVERQCGTPFTIKLPNFFPPMPVPADNPFTVEGIELGRQLFYEPLLSGDNSQSCAGCHQQNIAFTDTNRFSLGIDGFPGARNTMPIANLAYSPQLFWDGKAGSLEQQALFPIQSKAEMHEDLFKAVKELQESEKYPDLFYQAFCDSTITVDRMAKSLAQFMRTILSHSLKMAPGSVGFQSRSAVEELGYQVFINEKKGDCFHCHSVNIFTTNFEFANNGLFEGPGSDVGLFGQTSNPIDMGKFKTPSLLNLKYTAPYMHDGRFTNLRQVIDFYDTGFHVTPSLDVNLLKHTDGAGRPIPRTWTETEKAALLVFLMSLNDEAVLVDQRYSSP